MGEGSLRFFERPVFMHSDGADLFGILTEPIGAIRNVAVLFVGGGGMGPSSGRDQRNVVLCRRLAVDGYPVLRFDYAGVGDSTGSIERFQLDRPFVDDAVAALDRLAEEGYRRVVLMGPCFGARTSVATAATAANVEGLVLLATPVRDKVKDHSGVSDSVREHSLWHYASRGLRPQVLAALAHRERRDAYIRYARRQLHARKAHGSFDWISRSLVDQLSVVVAKGVPILFLPGVGGPVVRGLRPSLGGPARRPRQARPERRRGSCAGGSPRCARRRARPGGDQRGRVQLAGGRDLDARRVRLTLSLAVGAPAGGGRLATRRSRST